ncbi:hypothetical protein QOZ80_3AG0223040 [Eleusine coracana subsp. coracana]|nr:hypothetical protein QOZ80_3AG0223040 [Eleusine coracana subsp. coracana]
MPLAHAFISVSELKQLILTSDRHGRGRTRGRGPREGIAISNAQTGEDYTDENAMIPQNTTVLVRRSAGQLSDNIVLVSSRKVTEGCSVPSNKSVVTDSSSKSLSSTEVQDEYAAITAVIDAAELKLEDHQSKNGQAGGRFTSGSRYGHGPLEGETPPPGYVCRSCGVPGHFIQHCTQELKKPPPGYICYRCRIPGHFIQHCPTIGDTNFDKNKMTRSLAPVVTPSPADGILESLVSSASASAVDDLPAELHCQLCKKVMTDAVLTSKCCFDSFCDKCIRDYIITQSKCICGAKVLADSLIPNHTLRSTISNMLSTRAGSTSGTTKHRSSSGSNPDPKLQSHAPSAVSEREEMKQPMDCQVSEAGAPDGGVQIATKDNLGNQPLQKLSANVDPLGKDEVSSAELSAEKAAANAENLKLQNGSESTLNVTTVSGTLEQNATKTDQPKKKRKKAGSTKIVQPNNFDSGYNIPIDPAYYNTPFGGGYPWAAEAYMYGSMGMPYGGYPMGPYGVNPMNGMPPHALPMNVYPPNHHWHEAQLTPQQGTGTIARSRLSERPKDTGIQSRSSECNRQQGSSRGPESRNRARSSPERRDHRRSDRSSDDYYGDHSRKRMRVSSPTAGDKQNSQRSRHSSRSMTREDSSDDERNFKRRWGRRSSVTVDTRH